MAQVATPTKKTTRLHTVRWSRAEWERIVAAARLIAKQSDTKPRPVDVIRSGALRRASEIIGTAA